MTMPMMTRAHYRRELVAWAFLPVLMGVVEGGMISVIAKNAFEGRVNNAWLNFAVAVLAGAPAFANITSFLWAALANGRDKVRFMVALKIATAVMIVMIALLPLNALGLVLLTLLVIGTRACWAGVVTIRSTVWRANYPRNARANMAGKLATIQAFVIAGTGWFVAEMMTLDENSFRIIYPVAAIIGTVGALVYRGLRVRGQRALLRAERRDGSSLAMVNPWQLVRVLRDDRDYRSFMICMFIFGTGNMMITAPLVIMLRDVFEMSYRGGMLISGVIPIALMPLSIPIWSKLLDRMHVIRFRAIHSWTFVAAALAMLLAGLLVEPMLLWVAAVLKGFAFGGGVLAWNLGHHDFAPAHKASQYMGVHVTLTGLRGFLAPVLAVGLYELFNRAFYENAGSWVFAICLALNVIGAVGFMKMHRRMVARREKVDFGEDGPPVQPPAAG